MIGLEIISHYAILYHPTRKYMFSSKTIFLRDILQPGEAPVSATGVSFDAAAKESCVPAADQFAATGVRLDESVQYRADGPPNSNCGCIYSTLQIYSSRISFA